MKHPDIAIWEKEIEQLEADKTNVTNPVSVGALDYQILIRKASISNLGK